MRVLLDTHTFLWWVTDDDRLARRARALIADPTTEVLFSVVSAWEIVVKAGLGRLLLPEDPERFVPRHLAENAFLTLPVHLRHALRVGALPDLHRDPFDRLLVAQSTVENLPLMTGDPLFRQYPVEVIWD